jgi:hypothetical protein
MSSTNNEILCEIRDLLKVISNEQKQVLEEIKEMKTDQKRIHEELKFNNFVLNNIGIRSEIVN